MYKDDDVVFTPKSHTHPLLAIYRLLPLEKLGYYNQGATVPHDLGFKIERWKINAPE